MRETVILMTMDTRGGLGRFWVLAAVAAGMEGFC